MNIHKDKIIKMIRAGATTKLIREKYSVAHATIRAYRAENLEYLEDLAQADIDEHQGQLPFKGEDGEDMNEIPTSEVEETNETCEHEIIYAKQIADVPTGYLLYALAKRFGQVEKKLSECARLLQS